jgi:hypothetical protein
MCTRRSSREYDDTRSTNRPSCHRIKPNHPTSTDEIATHDTDELHEEGRQRTTTPFFCSHRG